MFFPVCRHFEGHVDGGKIKGHRLVGAEVGPTRGVGGELQLCRRLLSASREPEKRRGHMEGHRGPCQDMSAATAPYESR